MKEDHVTLVSLGVALVVVGYLVYFTASLASMDAGEYLMEKSLRNVDAYKLPEIYKNAPVFNGKVNSIMHAIVAVGAVGIALLTLLEYRKFAKVVRK
jgi:hypothetical protein